MSVFTVAYPDGRIGKDIWEIFSGLFGYSPDLDNMNRMQKLSNYRFMITKSWVASGFADRGIDVTESGETLEKTGSVIKDFIMESSAVIIGRRDNIKKVKDLYG